MQTTIFASENYQNTVRQKWNQFINNQDDDYSMIRPEVLASWKRSRDAGVNPHKLVNVLLSPDELSMKLNASMELRTIARPYMRQLYSIVQGSGAYILLSDNKGFILDVIGDDDIVYQGESYSRLVSGACRHEGVAGTNAVGTTLELGKPTQLWGDEHYIEWHKVYSCAGAPFYDVNDNLLGVLTVTCKMEYAHPHTLGMVTCAADSITREIRLKSTLNSLELLSKQRNMIIENMSSGVFLLTADGTVTHANSGALNMLGLNSRNIVGHNLFELISFDQISGADKIQEFLDAEHYNTEMGILVHPRIVPQKFNVSISHIKNSSDEVTDILLRINRPEMIQKLVRRIEGHHAKYQINDIIGNSPLMQRMKMEAERIARNESNVLILGESGTGKEMIAQSIHNASPVSNGPFVAINCAALPNNLVESELFGYERGAFTGANKEGRPGKFELADGGTIFLDEIGDMPLDVQATLLRVIQTKEVIRIGGNSPKKINIRIIAATNQDLLKAVEEKTFREDLYYRLNVFSIYAPPLRARGQEDIRLLADYFVETYNRNKNRSIRIQDNVYDILQNYHWPGNVRQLENAMERAINLADNNLITPELLPHQILQHAYNAGFSKETSKSPMQIPISATPQITLNSSIPSAYISPAPSSIASIPKATDSERALIEAALVQTHGQVTETAILLGMNRRTLYRRLTKFGLDPDQYRHK